MKTIYKSLVISFVCLLTPVYAPARQYPDSLLKYLELAAGNNPAVQQRFTEYGAALKRIPQAGALPDPQLDMGVFISPMELPSGDQLADLKLMQMFPWFGVLKNAKDEMSLMAKAKFELFLDSRLQVYYDVRRTWYELFRIRKEISITEKNIEILRVIEQLSLIKYKTPTPGGSGLTDVYRIRIEAGELRNSIAHLKDQEQTVSARFNSYLDRSPGAEIFTGDLLLQDTLNMNLAAVGDSIQRNNHVLKMISYEREAYLSRKKMATGMGYPMAGFGVNYSVIGRNRKSVSPMNGRDMLMPMVSVTIPIYRKKYTAMREEAELLGKASSLNYQDVSNSLNTEYYEAVQLYRDARRRAHLYEDQYLLASRSLYIMLKSYSSSSVSLTDVLRVRQQTLDYELKQVEAVTDLNTAIAWLDRLMATS